MENEFKETETTKSLEPENEGEVMAPNPEGPPEVDSAEQDLQAALESAKTELESAKAAQAELENRLLRLQADFDNYRRRTRSQMEEIIATANQELIKKFLPILDNLERALAVPAEGEEAAGIITGVEMIYRQIQELLQQEGVEVISAVGESFDPTRHEAIMQVASEAYPSNTVCEEVQKGYIMHGKTVLRPTMCKVVE